MLVELSLDWTTLGKIEINANFEIELNIESFNDFVITHDGVEFVVNDSFADSDNLKVLVEKMNQGDACTDNIKKELRKFVNHQLRDKVEEVEVMFSLFYNLKVKDLDFIKINTMNDLIGDIQQCVDIHGDHILWEQQDWNGIVTTLFSIMKNVKDLELYVKDFFRNNHLKK